MPVLADGQLRAEPLALGPRAEGRRDLRRREGGGGGMTGETKNWRISREGSSVLMLRPPIAHFAVPRPTGRQFSWRVVLMTEQAVFCT